MEPALVAMLADALDDEENSVATLASQGLFAAARADPHTTAAAEPALRRAIAHAAMGHIASRTLDTLRGRTQHERPDVRRAGNASVTVPGELPGSIRMSGSPVVRRELAEADVVAQLGALGVDTGGVLLVHTSFRATRPVEAGPLGLIRALRAALGPNGTLVMPSWTGDGDAPFDPGSTPAAADLGVVADTFWRLSGVARSEHPFAFAAAGPLAGQIISDPLPLPPHIPESPVGRVHEMDGQVLLLGVGHDADTTLHLAEILAGVPYRVPKYCTVRRDGRPVRVDYGENDHCCARFAFADGWLRARGLQSEGYVGHAPARLARSRDIVDTAAEHLLEDALVFLHPDGAGCTECDEARGSIRG